MALNALQIALKGRRTTQLSPERDITLSIFYPLHNMPSNELPGAMHPAPNGQPASRPLPSTSSREAGLLAQLRSGERQNILSLGVNCTTQKLTFGLANASLLQRQVQRRCTFWKNAKFDVHLFGFVSEGPLCSDTSWSSVTARRSYPPG